MRLPWLALLPVLLMAAIAAAQDLVRDSIPEVWIDQYLPEKLPELKYPAYYNDLDKARAQVFSGRYKTALLTLRKVAKGDPAEIAEIKASAVSAMGRHDEALAALSDPAIAQ